jgi:peptide/nickel transport system substrate-binding protein
MLLVVALVLSGCGTAATPSVTTEVKPAAPRILTIGAHNPPPDMALELGLSSTNSSLSIHLAHDQLVEVNTRNDTVIPALAEPIAVDRGTWVINPDGTMDTIWRLRPGVRWHDGAPFTSSDLMFTFEVTRAPGIPNAIPGLQLWSSAESPDDTTFILHWKSPFVMADRAPGLSPLPRHILETPYRQSELDTFLAHPWFQGGFVGLGPYRVDRFDVPVEVQLVAFDGYYQGRPPLDRVVVRFVQDYNTLVANIMSGAVDAVISPGVDIDVALDLRKRWEGTGHEVHIVREGTTDLRHLEVSFRPEGAQPRNFLLDLSVRQALFQAINRKELSDLKSAGHSPIADSWITPTQELRRQVESAIPAYPFDPARSARLLADAGWVRGADGLLVDPNPVGQGRPMDIKLWSSEGQNTAKDMTLIATYWQALGAKTSTDVVPAALASDREYRSLLPGVKSLGGIGFEALTSGRLHSRSIPAPENRWSGQNRGAYSSPQADAILDRLSVTIDANQQVELHRQLLAIAMVDLAIFPLYWEVQIYPVLKGVNNIQTGVWNKLNWTKTS